MRKPQVTSKIYLSMSPISYEIRSFMGSALKILNYIIYIGYINSYLVYIYLDIPWLICWPVNYRIWSDFW